MGGMPGMGRMPGQQTKKKKNTPKYRWVYVSRSGYRAFFQSWASRPPTTTEEKKLVLGVIERHFASYQSLRAKNMKHISDALSKKLPCGRSTGKPARRPRRHRRTKEKVVKRKKRAATYMFACEGKDAKLDKGTGNAKTWRCQHGEVVNYSRRGCIDASRRCNGLMDGCGDMSDEQDCYQNVRNDKTKKVLTEGWCCNPLYAPASAFAKVAVKHFGDFQRLKVIPGTRVTEGRKATQRWSQSCSSYNNPVIEDWIAKAATDGRDPSLRIMCDHHEKQLTEQISKTLNENFGLGPTVSFEKPEGSNPFKCGDKLVVVTVNIPGKTSADKPHCHQKYAFSASRMPGPSPRCCNSTKRTKTRGPAGTEDSKWFSDSAETAGLNETSCEPFLTTLLYALPQCFSFAGVKPPKDCNDPCYDGAQEGKLGTCLAVENLLRSAFSKWRFTRSNELLDATGRPKPATDCHGVLIPSKKT